MTDTPSKIQEFVHFVRCLEGSEMRDAQTFYDRLFQAFGHNGWFDSGAQIEYPIKSDGEHTKFADLVWRPRLLLEMKSRGKKLEKYHKQVFSYWNALTSKPRYVVLCNFDEFWIYDTLVQIEEPVNFVKLEDLPKKYDALNFLFPGNLGFNADNEIIYYDNIPPNGVLQFVGREEEVKKLDELLQQQNGRKIAVIVGMGGVGKTEFAKQYALRHLQNCRESKSNISTGGVCWLDGREGDIARQIVSFARSFLNLNPPEDWDIPTQLNYCWRNWRTGEWLMVIDDVTEYGKIKPYLPPESSNFTILITRREKLGRSFAHLPLETLQPQPALDLLKSLVGAERIDQELEIAEKICSWLGYLPLGLELVGRYLDRDPDLSLKTMFSLLEKKRLRHTSILKADAIMTAKLGVNDAFELSWERLDDNAQELGCMLSLFALADIPWELVKQAYQNLPVSENEEIDLDIVEEARGDLLDFNLLERTGQGSYRFHPLIREFLREKREESEKVDNFKTGFISAVLKVAEQISESLTKQLIKSFTPVIPHLSEIAIEKYLSDLLNDDHITKPFSRLAAFYISQGLYNQALFWLETGLSVMQIRYKNPEHPNIIYIELNLGCIYRLLGKYNDAELMYINALKIYEKFPDTESIAKATLLNNLALVYKINRRYSEAETCYLQALELVKNEADNVSQKKLPLILINLAAVYCDTFKYKESESLHLEALEKIKKIYGEENLHLAFCLYNLANLYFDQELYSEAENLYLESLSMRKKLLGEEHPDIAATLHCLANLHYKMGQFSESEIEYLNAFKIFKQFVGQEHPDIANTLNGLAIVYEAQNDLTKSEFLFLEALNLRQRLLGKDHIEVADTLYELSRLYYSQCRYIESENLLKQCLDIRQKQLGVNHPDTVNCREGLSIIRNRLKYTNSKLLNFKQKSKKGNSQNKPKGFGKK